MITGKIKKIIEREGKEMSTEAILKERSSSHGDFTDVAAMEQNLILTMEAGVKWNEMTAVQRCSLRMIQHKISRILSGNPDYADHWDDIAGYAKITRDRLKYTDPIGVKPDDPIVIDGSLGAGDKHALFRR